MFFKKDKRKFSKESYSQCGEDLIIDYIFNLRGVNKPSYIDIGSNHPFFINNTYYFYLKGSKGVNIDANSLLIEKFNKDRPNDINLNFGISDTNGFLQFYIMEDDTLSTFSLTECEKMISFGKKLSYVENVRVVTMHDVLEKYCGGIFPDLFTIDVEGFDFQIIKSIDFNITSPKIICIEAADYSPIGAGERRIDLIDFLKNKGYYEYANTNLNSILVRSDFWFI